MLTEQGKLVPLSHLSHFVHSCCPSYFDISCLPAAVFRVSDFHIISFPEESSPGLHNAEVAQRKRAGTKNSGALVNGREEESRGRPSSREPLLGHLDRSGSRSGSLRGLLLLLLLAASKNCNSRKSENRDGLHIILLVLLVELPDPRVG